MPGLFGREPYGGHDANPHGAPLKLLSDTAVQQFVRDGYLVIQIPEDELPSSHHAEIYQRALEEANRPEPAPEPSQTNSEKAKEAKLAFGFFQTGVQQRVWGAVGKKVEECVRSPTYSGALSSLLGNDFIIGASSGHMHVTQPGTDQQFHK